jgi:hypothetical protein
MQRADRLTGQLLVGQVALSHILEGRNVAAPDVQRLIQMQSQKLIQARIANIKGVAQDWADLVDLIDALADLLLDLDLTHPHPTLEPALLRLIQHARVEQLLRTAQGAAQVAHTTGDTHG